MEWRWLTEEIAPSGVLFPGIVKDNDTSVVMVNISYYLEHIPVNAQGTTLGSVLDMFCNMCLRMLRVKTVRVVVFVAGGKPHFLKKKREKTCRAKDGPYAPLTEAGVMPKNWNEGPGLNYRVIRREILPALFNRFMTSFVMPEMGKYVVLSGFPGQLEWVHTRYDDPIYLDANWGVDGTQSYQQIQLWQRLPLTKAIELKDPKLYHRTFQICLDHTGQMRHTEWTEMENSIECPHMRMLYFLHAFTHDRVEIQTTPDCADLIGAGILHAFERIDKLFEWTKFEMRGSVKISWPHPTHLREHIDLDALYKAINQYVPFVQCKSMLNPELMCVWLMLMAQYPDQLYHRRTFFSEVNKYGALCMMSKSVKRDTRATQRVIVVDEDLMERLFPYETDARQLSRQLEYILNYLKLTPLGQEPSPFDSYFPYAKNVYDKPILMPNNNPRPEPDLPYRRLMYATFQTELVKRQKK